MAFQKRKGETNENFFLLDKFFCTHLDTTWHTNMNYKTVNYSRLKN